MWLKVTIFNSGLSPLFLFLLLSFECPRRLRLEIHWLCINFWMNWWQWRYMRNIWLRHQLIIRVFVSCGCLLYHRGRWIYWCGVICSTGLHSWWPFRSYSIAVVRVIIVRILIAIAIKIITRLVIALTWLLVHTKLCRRARRWTHITWSQRLELNISVIGGQRRIAKQVILCWFVFYFATLFLRWAKEYRRQDTRRLRLSLYLLFLYLLGQLI